VSELGSDNNQPSIPASPNSLTYELDTLHNRMTELRNEIFRNCETYLAASTKSHTRRLDNLSERMAELHDATIEKYDHYDLALTQSSTRSLGHLQERMDELQDDMTKTYANYKHEFVGRQPLLVKVAVNMNGYPSRVRRLERYVFCSVSS
jgi:DNA anti-recombination protein RmuC